MIAVTSSNISHVGYDAEKRVLKVRFNNGGCYEYSGIPQDVYDNLVTADSIGAYLAKYIKGKFEYRKVEPFLLTA